jgi:membrane fusion protein (multidrug efflux system)
VFVIVPRGQENLPDPNAPQAAQPKPGKPDADKPASDKQAGDKQALAAPDSTPVARQVFVQAGPRRGDQVAILKGIKEGDEVVTSGQLKLRNGMAVEIDNTVQPDFDPNPAPVEQ